MTLESPPNRTLHQVKQTLTTDELAKDKKTKRETFLLILSGCGVDFVDMKAAGFQLDGRPFGR